MHAAAIENRTERTTRRTGVSLRAAALSLWMALAAWCGVVAAEEAPSRAGQGNLVLAEKAGKLTGSFTYQLIVGHFYEWNTDPTAVPGILRELGARSNVKARVEFKAIALDDGQLLRNPVLLMTGNRAFILSKQEQANLRRYLTRGGFLYVDDCGGADWSLRRMIRQVLPKGKLEPLKPDHAIFRRPYKLPGVPKVVDLYHGKAKAFGVALDGRLAVVYTYDTDIPCAWERYPDGSYVHVIDKAKREAAVRFGVNVLDFALRQHLGKVKAPARADAATGLPKPAPLPEEAVRNYPMRRQLPSSYITAMAADQRYVWFGGFTFLPGQDEGLARYDKRSGQWRVFMDAEGVLSEEINSLAVKDGKVLVGADTWKWTKGMAVFDPADGTWSTMNTADGLPHNRVVDIAKDGDDLWLACRLGLAVLRAGKKRAEAVTAEAFPEGGPYMIGVLADKNSVWANHFAGIARLDKASGQWRDVKRLSPLVPKHAMDMAAGGGATWLLAAHEKGVRLVRFDDKRRAFSEWKPAADVDLSQAVSLAADEKDVFVGTKNQGIYAFPIGGGAPTHHGVPRPLPKGTVRRILPDGETVWATVLPNGGLWRLNRTSGSWRHVPYRAGTPASHVLSLRRVGGRLYVGMLAAGPWVYDLRKARWQSLNLLLLRQGHPYVYLGEHNPIRWENIYAIVPVGGEIWMGTNHGLIVHDPARTPEGFEIVGPTKLLCKGLAEAEGLLWVATGSGEVLACDPAKRQWQEKKKWSLPAPAQAMCVWRGAFYVATEKGIFRRPTAGTKPAAVDLAAEGPYGVWPTPGALWVASKAGLHRLNDAGKKPTLLAGSGAWGHVNCVAELDKAVLVGTSAGLFVCDGAGTLRAFHDAASGLGGSAIGAIAVENGRVWLGTLGAGMTRIDAAALKPTK